MILKQKATVGARYKLFNKVNGKLVPLLNGAESKNLVPNVFFDYLYNTATFTSNSQTGPRPPTANSTGYIGFNLSQQLAVGTGATPPAAGDTALESQLAIQTMPSAVNTVYINDTANSRVTWRLTTTHTFPLGGVVGNLSELGLYARQNSNSLLVLQSRTLIKDELGDPTTQTLTNEDQLVVVTEFDVHIPYVLQNYQQDYNGVTYNVDYRLYFNPSFSNAPDTGFHYCLANLESPVSALSNYMAAVSQPWVMSSNESYLPPNRVAIDNTLITPLNPATGVRKQRFRVGLSQANFVGGLAGIVGAVKGSQPLSGTQVCWQFQFTPPLPKDNTFLFELEVQTTFGNIP